MHAKKYKNMTQSKEQNESSRKKLLKKQELLDSEF